MCERKQGVKRGAGEMAFKTTVLLLSDKRVILINSGYPYVCLCARARPRVCVSLIYEEDVILVQSNVNYSAY